MDLIKKIFINGKKYETSECITIETLLDYFNYTKMLFVLEYNNEICEKKMWSKIIIKNKDKIEIVTIVGGG
jgi:thiamine biosynthesis protein ThiS